jgi:hypothetical protein
MKYDPIESARDQKNAMYVILYCVACVVLVIVYAIVRVIFD